jgi:hypothetical protein
LHYALDTLGVFTYYIDMGQKITDFHREHVREDVLAEIDGTDEMYGEDAIHFGWTMRTVNGTVRLRDPEGDVDFDEYWYRGQECEKNEAGRGYSHHWRTVGRKYNLTEMTLGELQKAIDADLLKKQALAEAEAAKPEEKVGQPQEFWEQLEARMLKTIDIARDASAHYECLKQQKTYDAVVALQAHLVEVKAQLEVASPQVVDGHDADMEKYLAHQKAMYLQQFPRKVAV